MAPPPSPPAASCRVDALLFDLGGVLIDIDGERVFSHWARCSGVPVETLRARFQVDEAYRQFERGELAVADYFATLRARLDIDLADADLLVGWNAMLVGEKPGIRTLLERAAARYPLYLFSNTNSAHQVVWAREFAALLSPFARLFVSSEIGRRKPDPAAFRYVADAIGLAPERILFLDDAEENIAGAQSIGMPAIHVHSSEDIARTIGRLDERGAIGL